MSEKARKIFENWNKNLTTSREGIAIKDARSKETMVVTRYGGDILFAFFDNETSQIEFMFLAEMGQLTQKNWNSIFTSFVEIKARLKNG